MRDTATGLVRFGARDYDPSIGRWTCKDPIGFEGGNASLYAYVNGHPISSSDPTGTWPYYGNWGGPGWTNGTNKWVESGDFPHLPGQQGYVPPVDVRDEVYREHDVDLMHCAKINDPIERQKCRREADVDLAGKLWMMKTTSSCRGDPRILLEILIFGPPWSPNNNDKQ
jgi:RHS repeat-associated protein